MEYEKSLEQPTIKKLLGAEHESDNRYGIVNEYEGFIQRHAYDYLMVGFVTDTDQIETQREERFEKYLDRIEADFAQYRIDVKRWNQDHTDNADPERWQTQEGEYNTGIFIRRADLPPKEVCEQAIIKSSAIGVEPSREDIKVVSQEGIEKYFDLALRDSYELLKQQQADVVNELPVAPHEEYEPGVRTHQQLVREYARNVSRMSAIEEIYIERNPVDAVDNLAYLQPELLGDVSPITEKIYIVRSLGKATAELVRTA